MDFQIQQKNFAGPLELLVELIEKNKLAVSEISLADVADSYLDYVRSLERINPERLGEFLVVAAQLILIKSKSLLPDLSLSEEEEKSIEELTERLAEYQEIRRLAHVLARQEGAGGRIASREAYTNTEPVFSPPHKLTGAHLHTAMMNFLASLPAPAEIVQQSIKKVISLEEKITHIHAFLQHAVERGFSDIIKGSREKVDVIVSFLAILELAKQRFVDLHQQSAFKDIRIKKMQ